MTVHNVQVNHGNKRIATMRIVAADKATAVRIAERQAREFHNVKAQVALIGSIVR